MAQFLESTLKCLKVVGNIKLGKEKESGHNVYYNEGAKDTKFLQNLYCMWISKLLSCLVH
jgi:hypothetical protein